MLTGLLPVRRSLVRLGPLGLVAAVVVVVVATLAGAVGYVQMAAEAGARDVLDEVAPAGRAIQVSAGLADDPEAQDRALTDLVDAALPGVAYGLHRSLVTRPVPIAAVDGGPPASDGARAVLFTFDGIADRAALAAGTWPAGRGEVAVHAAAADVLDLEVGTRVGLDGGDTFTVVGIWEPRDRADPFWFGEQQETTGQDGTRLGPFVVVEADLAERRPFVRWRLAPELATLSSADAQVLARALPRLRSRVGDDPVVVVAPWSVSGELSSTLGRVNERTRAARGAGAAAVGMLALAALVVLWQVARLLAYLRSRETGLLRARGASGWQLLAWNLAEGLVVLIPAMGTGTLLAVGALARLGPTAASVPATTGRAAVLVGFAAVVVLLVAAVVSRARRQAGAAPDRVRSATTTGGAILVLVAAGLSTWQFRRFGSPIVPETGTIDVLAAIAPALVLLAFGAVVLVLLGPLAAGWQRLTRRGRGVEMVLPARQVGRRLRVAHSR